MRPTLLTAGLLLMVSLAGCGEDPNAAAKNAAPLSITKEQAAAIQANDKAVEDDEHRPEPKAAKSKAK